MAFVRLLQATFLVALLVVFCVGSARADPGDGTLEYGGPGHCTAGKFCDDTRCYEADAMISVMACQCDQLDAKCGVGNCHPEGYREGQGCDDPLFFGVDSEVTSAMCDGVAPIGCNNVSVSGYCSGNVFCQGGNCQSATAPMSELACGCGMLNPTCGMGQCIEGAYCEGSGCPDAVCYVPWSPISLAMCGGVPFSGCGMNCAPPLDEVAFWPLDEDRTTAALTTEWNPDDFTGASAQQFASAIQYLPPQRNVTAFGFGEDWSGFWFHFPAVPATLSIELFDSTTATWVPAFSQLYPQSGALQLAGQTWTFATPLGMVTAVRISSYSGPNVVSANDDFLGFGSGTMFLTADTTLRPKDIAARNHGTASDTKQYATATGPTAPTPTNGKVRGALSFDGNGNVVVAPLHFSATAPNQKASHNYVDLSLEAWIQPAQLDGAQRSIVAFTDRATGVVSYTMRLQGSEILFDADFGNNSLGGASTGAGIVAGVWTHVAVVASLSNGSLTFYVNGAAVSASPYSLFSMSALVGDQWQIGSDATVSGSALSFNGEIDEVKVFERARSAGEVLGAFSAGADGTCRRDLIMTSPHNGRVFEGLNSGRLVPVTGYSLVAGQAVRIEARDPNGVWSFVGSTAASLTADATGMYPWFVSVMPVPSPPPPLPRWRDTGLAWLRVVAQAGGFEGFTVDDPLCFAENAVTPVVGLDLVSNCRGNLGSMATLVDSDNASQSVPFFPPVEARKNVQNISGATHYLWKKTTAPVPAVPPVSYYNAIGAWTGQPRDTLAKWKAINNFPVNEVNAIYFNAQDLRLGRDMHCKEVFSVEGSQPLCPNGPAKAIVRTAC